MSLDRERIQEKRERFNEWMAEKIRNKYYSDHEKMMLAYEKIL
jgi:hypothetical protein